jgi:outer membrane protein insertion porin family
VKGVLDADRGFIPPQKLFYGGGPTTVRGFRRNRLGPIIYVARPSLHDTTVLDTVPSATGGQRIVVSTVELTVPSPFLRERLRLAAFVDGGRVWNAADTLLADPGFRITPGAGLRVASPVGPIRLDVAFNGYPQTQGPLYLINNRGDIVGRLDDDFALDRPLSFFRRLVLHVSIGQTF